MKRRFTKRPIAAIAVVVGSLLVGLSLSPVGAQSGLTNGQVTVRSDGAVYLIMNNQRRWVATVQITDEEINAYPEAEPIYAGMVPFGSASAGTAAKTGTTTAAKTGTTTASKTGTTTASKTGSGNSTIASKTASKTTGSTSSSTEDEVQDGEVVINPTSGADAKDPNDPTLAAVTTSVDPNAKAEPTGKTTCPDSHQIKGGFDKYYWDTDRPDYATIEPEACFVSGAYAREFGYTEVKKRPSSSSSSTTTNPR